MQGKSIFKSTMYCVILLATFSCSDKVPDKPDATEKAAKTEPAIATIKPDDPIEIVLTIYGGDHFYSLILGSDSTKVALEYNSIERDSFDTHRHILSQEAIDHIWKYVQDNCTPSEGKLAGGENYYNIGRAVDSPLYKIGCRVESKELGIKYFTGLIKWIESSPFKKECKYLIGDIRGKFIEGGMFALTPYQQRILNSMRQKIPTDKGRR